MTPSPDTFADKASPDGPYKYPVIHTVVYQTTQSGFGLDGESVVHEEAHLGEAVEDVFFVVPFNVVEWHSGDYFFGHYDYFGEGFVV